MSDRNIPNIFRLFFIERVSLLQTGGISGIYSFLAKFILVLLALDAAFLSEKLEKKEGLRLALTMAGSMCIFVTGRLEQILYGENKWTNWSEK